MQHPGLIAFLCILALFSMWWGKPAEKMSRVELRAQMACYSLAAAAFNLLSRILRC